MTEKIGSSRLARFQTDVKKSKNSHWKRVCHQLLRDKVAFFSLCFLASLILGAILIPCISSHAYYDIHLSLKNSPPSKLFWFGTDELGRSLFTRIWWGARISLFMGISAALIDMIIGIFYGALGGMIGGKVEELMMRIADILHSLPHLLIVILLMVVMKSGIFTMIVALAITGWINMARIVRGQILQIKQHDFVMAAYMLGASRWRILIRHLISNAVGPIITTMTFTIPIAIFSEVFLSFLGLGIQAPMASWGTMASDGLSALRYYPWRFFFPTCFITLTLFSFNLIGDRLRDAFDPRLRK